MLLPELDEILKLKNELSPYGEVIDLGVITRGSRSFPIPAFSIGSRDPDAPVLGIIGGVHGLERIGTWVAISYLKHLSSRIAWDESLQDVLKKLRIFFVPLVNPVGMSMLRRSNGNGVDLMRNAPLDSTDASFGVGGQSLSSRLPWFRGNKSQTEAGMELENRLLLDYVRKQTNESPCALILDLHSGFGLVDQIWVPYAKSREVYSRAPEVFALKELLDQVLPHHIYRFEPQSKHYRTHGDIWDYLMLEREKKDDGRLFLPLTLEMGSWNWVKKNPLQIFSFLGPFNPVKVHRQKRTLRRHIPLFHFLKSALSSNRIWTSLSSEKRDSLHRKAVERWYGSAS